MFRSRSHEVVALLASLALVTSVSACGQSNEEKAASSVKKALTDAGFQEPDTVSKDTVRAWPAKFCSLSVGMTREEIRKVMGEPTSAYNDSNNNQDQWEGYGIDLTAFYDINDRTKSLQDSTGEANLPCDESRFK